MMINTKIIKLNAPDFSIDRVCRRPGRADIFLFDTSRLEILQLSPTYEPIHRLVLKDITGIRQIDTAFFTADTLVIADSLEKKLFRLRLEFDGEDGKGGKVCDGDGGGEDNGGRVLIKGTEAFPLPPGSIITAAAVMPGYYLLLDKGLSMLRLYDEDFRELRTVGSRMGYVLAYEDRAKPRLGFEFPEDLAAGQDAVIVADSGNKRLVVINPETRQLEKIIDLPDFPFKILAREDDRIMVSDFDRSVMTVSLKYGFVHSQELETPVDFLPSTFQSHAKTVLVGSEAGELVELSFPGTPLASIAETAGNWRVLMHIKLDRQEPAAARDIASAHQELLLEYARATIDPSWNEPLSAYISDTLPGTLERNETLKKEIAGLSLEFIKKYKAIPDSDDKEAVHIEKENFRHAMFLDIKAYRDNLQAIKEIVSATKNYPPAAKLLEDLLNERFAILKETLAADIKEIKNNLAAFNELDMLTAIVLYWLHSEEVQVLFRDRGFSYEKLFGDKFLLAILRDFYYHIALLFLEHHKIDEYISFCDRELTMFPGKTGIARLFIDKLIALKKHDDALRMLKKFPDQNKENVNYLYYRLYWEKGDTDKAFVHLRKELELYTHRLQLIPQLIRLNKMNREEVTAYIDKILEKSGQGIDIYLNTASAFQAIGDLEQAKTYIEKELELYPENQNAIAFKLNLLLNRPDREEMRRLVTRLTAPAHALIRAKVYYFLEDFQESWHHFKDFIKTNADETNVTINLYLTGSLNHLVLGEPELRQLEEMSHSLKHEAYKREIFTYFSYLKHIEKKPLRTEVEEFTAGIYLSTAATAKLAYKHFLSQLKLPRENQTPQELLELAETILKCNPGDEQVFSLLDEIAAEEK